MANPTSGSFAEAVTELSGAPPSVTLSSALVDYRTAMLEAVTDGTFRLEEAADRIAEEQGWERMRVMASHLDKSVPADDPTRSQLVSILGDLMQAIEDKSPRRVVLAARQLREIPQPRPEVEELADELERHGAKEGLGQRRSGGSLNFSRTIGLEILDWIGHQVKPRIGGIVDAFDDFYRREDIRAAVKFLEDAGYMAKAGPGSNTWYAPTARGLAWYRRRWGRNRPSPSPITSFEF